MKRTLIRRVWREGETRKRAEPLPPGAVLTDKPSSLQCSKCSSLCRRCQLPRRCISAEPPNHGKVGEAAVSTYFRRLKIQFYIGTSSFLLGKGPVFFLVGFKNDLHRPPPKNPCHRKTASNLIFKIQKNTREVLEESFGRPLIKWNE